MLSVRSRSTHPAAKEVRQRVAQYRPVLRLGEPVVPGRYRRVGGEDALLPHCLHVRVREVGRRTPAEAAGEESERQQGGVPLVDVVVHIVGEAGGLEDRRAPDAEHHLLAEPVARVATVERVGEAAIELGVLGQVGVEEVDRHRVPVGAPHQIAPGAHVHLAPLDVQRRSRVHRLEELLRLPGDGRLALMALGIEVLVEVALPVEERHGNHRHVQVRRRAKGVARQHTQPATVRGDLLFEADLHREVGDDGARVVGHARDGRVRTALERLSEG